MAKFKRRKKFSNAKRAFTLIEIMLVILIIAILVTLLYTVVARSKPKVEVSKARAQIRALDMAFRAYKSMYGEWPSQTQGERDTVYTYDNTNLVEILVGNNPKNIIFFQVDQSELVYTGTNANGSAYKRGFADPWGDAYVICLDHDNDNRIYITNLTAKMTDGRSPGPDQNISFTNFVYPSPVVIFSFGGAVTDTVSSLDQRGLIGFGGKD